MDVKERIQNALNEAAMRAGVRDVPATLEFPSELEHGDYASNIALAAAKEVGKPPRELAEEIIKHLDEIDGVASVDIAGPGFINFSLTPSFFAHTLGDITAAGEVWGKAEQKTKETVMIEFISPNPFKAFHIGHLMSMTIGESLVRLSEAMGTNVVRASYHGDVGPHVAKALWGIKKLDRADLTDENLGKAYATGATAYKEDAAAKEEIDAINKAIYEKSDPELMALYEKGREASLEHFEKLYEILGSHLDERYFESEVWQTGKQLVEEHPEVFPESDGARIYCGKEKGLHTRVFLTSKGLPTYETKDLGLAKKKAETHPECSEYVTVTAVEQKEYFHVVKAAMADIYPELAEKIVHITHGMLTLPSGKMSSRTGDIIAAAALLQDVTEAARERAKESRADDADTLAQQIALAALKYQILKQGTEKDIVFDRERALSLEGDSGPYLQYTYARARAVLAKATEEGIAPRADDSAEPSETARLLLRFPEIAARAAREYAPHHVAQYLTELASSFNSFYAQNQILDGTSQAAHKLALTAAVATTLKNGLWMLGIEAPERM